MPRRKQTKRAASPRVPELPTPGALASANGYASRFEQLKTIHYKRQLEVIDQMLTDAGVPEWVMVMRSDGVPANSVPCRLEWYLARRKNVKASEIDKDLQREMAEMLRYAQARHNVELSDSRPK